MYNIHGCLLQVLLAFQHKGGISLHTKNSLNLIHYSYCFSQFYLLWIFVFHLLSASSPFSFPKYFDEDTNENEDDNNNNVKGDSKGTLYYGTITTSKPLKSNKGILLWHVQYDDNDSEDFDKEEVVEAIDLYILCTKHQ